MPTRTTSLNKACMFPAGALSYYVRIEPTLLFAVRMPPTKRKVKITESVSDFILNTCHSCPFFTEKADIDAAISQLQETDHTQYREKYTGLAHHRIRQFWCKDNNKCAGIDTVSTCAAGHSHTGSKVIEVPVFEHFFVWNPNSRRGDEAFRFYASREQGKQFMLKPYEFGNVFSHAGVCWGRNAKPQYLKQAYNLYWSAPFNGDLTNRQHSLEHTLKNWTPDRAGVWEDQTNEYFGAHTKFAVRSRQTEGVLVTSQLKTIEVLPTEYLFNVRGQALAVAWIRHQPNDPKTWYLNFVRAIPDAEGKRPNLIAKRSAAKASATSKLQILGTIDDIS